MDAIECEGWRVLPVTSEMGDEAGYRACAALHVPSYALLPSGLYGGANQGLIVGLDAFFVVHVLLNLLFIDHPEYRFRSAFSALILGAGLFGVVDLLLIL